MSEQRKNQIKKRQEKNIAQPIGEIVQQPLAQSVGIPAGYAKLLNDLKLRIRTARVKANLSVNRELVLLYWEIGKVILQRQSQEGLRWGCCSVLGRDEEHTTCCRRNGPEMSQMSHPRSLSRYEPLMNHMRHGPGTRNACVSDDKHRLGIYPIRDRGAHEEGQTPHALKRAHKGLKGIIARRAIREQRT